jgi:hypothetical protein
MYVVSFHSIFNENALLLSKRMGIPFITDLSPNDGDILVVFGAHHQADKLFYLQEVKKIHYILIQSEQYCSEVFDQKYYMELIQNHSLLDFSRFNVEQLKSRIECKVFSFYFFDFIMPDLSDWDSRPIDFFFCGLGSDERKKKLDEFKRENPSANIEIDLSYSYTNPNALTEKLKQVKYVINLPYYENNALETHRINRALSAGCEVITLYSKDKYSNKLYAPYVHFVRELTDFTLLLEHERKGNYLALMEDFGFKSIESNVRGIQHAERNWLNAYKKIEGKENVLVS